MIDLHSHILFGLDDGAKNLEESVKMAQVAAKDGIEKIVGTPHLFRGNFVQKELSVIRQKKEELGQRLEDIGVDIELYTGAEVHISHDLMNEIRENREHLVIHNSSYMLIEFPSTHIFSGIKHLFFELMSEEIIPIIAHPERNSVFRENPALLYDLIEIGALAQANSGSFVGLYGRKTMEAVSQFLSWNFIHFIGSDAHSSRSLSPKLADAFFKVGEMIGEERAFALVWDNPQAVLRDEDIPYRYDP
ncbi:MAG: hypothetical protein JXB23_18390, partial [Candidatus Aminicenantes bacterium]|nr:hypothetical protein [Candidatus Aminicenantes bacterium]